MTGEGHINGLAIRYSGPTDPDLEGDFFTKGTYLGRGREFDLYYEHGFDGALKRTPIGHGALKFDDAGAWFEAQLEVADEYAEQIKKLIEAGKLGYSSGAVSHLVDREQVGKAAWHIKSWPIGEVSLTPRPAEPRNVVALKAYKELIDNQKAEPETGQEAPVSATAKGEGDRLDINITIKNETKEMADKEKEATEQVKSDNKQPEPSPVTASKKDEATVSNEDVLARLEALADDVSEIKAQGGKTVKHEFSAPNTTYVKTPGDNFYNAFGAYMVGGDTGGVKHMRGENGGVLIDGLNMAHSSLKSARDSGISAKDWLKAVNDSTWNITTGADGGSYVETPLANEIVARKGDSMLADRLGIRRIPIGRSTTTTIVVDNENQFGEAFTTTSESAAYTRDQAAISLVTFTLVKKTKKMDFTEELLRDAKDEGTLFEFVGDYIGRALAISHNADLITEFETAGGSTVGKAAASATAITAAELQSLLYIEALGPYIENDESSVAWLTSRANFGAAMALASSSVFTLDSNPGGNGFNRQLFNYPVVVSSSVPAIAAGKHSFYFGNYRYVGLAESPSLEVLRDPYSRAANGEVLYHYFTRYDYEMLQSQAVVHVLQKKT